MGVDRPANRPASQPAGSASHRWATRRNPHSRQTRSGVSLALFWNARQQPQPTPTGRPHPPLTRPRPPHLAPEPNTGARRKAETLRVESASQSAQAAAAGGQPGGPPHPTKRRDTGSLAHHREVVGAAASAARRRRLPPRAAAAAAAAEGRGRQLQQQRGRLQPPPSSNAGRVEHDPTWGIGSKLSRPRAPLLTATSNAAAAAAAKGSRRQAGGRSTIQPPRVCWPSSLGSWLTAGGSAGPVHLSQSAAGRRGHPWQMSPHWCVLRRSTTFTSRAVVHWRVPWYTCL